MPRGATGSSQRNSDQPSRRVHGATCRRSGIRDCRKGHQVAGERPGASLAVLPALRLRALVPQDAARRYRGCCKTVCARDNEPDNPAYREPSAPEHPSVPRTRRESPSGARPEIADFGRSAGRSSASPESASPLQATCRRPGDRVSAAPMAARAPRRGGPPEKACIPGFARCRTRSTERLCCPLLACGARTSTSL